MEGRPHAARFRHAVPHEQALAETAQHLGMWKQVTGDKNGGTAPDDIHVYEDESRGISGFKVAYLLIHGNTYNSSKFIQPFSLERVRIVHTYKLSRL